MFTTLFTLCPLQWWKNRCLYARSQMEFQFTKYNLNLTGIIHKVTKNDTNYICHRCHRYLKKPHIPAQVVSNKLQIFEVLTEIKNLNRLERILIARRILFKKFNNYSKESVHKT